MRPVTRTALLWAAGIAVSGVFAWLALRDTRWSEVWRGLRESDYLWLVPALAALVLTVLLKAVRWQFLFRRESRPPLRPLVSALLVGYFFNNLLPARAGEAARIVALNQRAGTSRAEAAATVVLERAYDVLLLLVLLFVALPWLPDDVRWLRAAAILGIGLVVGLALVIAVLARFGDRPLRVAVRPLARLPFLSEERVDAAARNLAHGLEAVRNVRIATAAFALTTLSWLALALSFWLLMRGFGLGLPPLAGVLGVIAVNLALILPSSPAGVGVFEAGILVALDAYGVPRSQALSYALVLHALNLVPYLFAGALVLHLHALGLRRGNRPAVTT